jgi:hypothetical protein
MLTVYGTQNGLLLQYDGSIAFDHVADSVWIDMFEPTRNEEFAVEGHLRINIPRKRR